MPHIQRATRERERGPAVPHTQRSTTFVWSDYDHEPVGMCCRTGLGPSGVACCTVLSVIHLWAIHEIPLVARCVDRCSGFGVRGWAAVVSGSGFMVYG